MKKLFIILAGTLIIAASGCSSTMTLGPQANKDKCLNVSAGWNHVGVTLPLVKVGAKVLKDE